MSTGRQPVLRRGQWRVEPPQPASGRVWRPPALHQPPLQGRAAEGMERAGPSPSEHLIAAEGPALINQPPAVVSPTGGDNDFLVKRGLASFFSQRH